MSASFGLLIIITTAILIKKWYACNILDREHIFWLSKNNRRNMQLLIKNKIFFVIDLF